MSSVSVWSALSDDGDDKRKGKHSLKMWHLRPVQHGFVEAGPSCSDSEDALSARSTLGRSRRITRRSTIGSIGWIVRKLRLVEDLHSEFNEDDLLGIHSIHHPRRRRQVGFDRDVYSEIGRAHV